MANTQTETKVIQVRFDNRKFEKNIQATIKSTEKLDKSLQFKGSKKGIEDLSKELEKLDTGKLDKDLEKTDKQLNNISITLGSLLKIKLLSKAIDVVTRSAVNMIKSMTGINNIVAGWDAYNESLTTTGGILNQVERDGYNLEDVADAMEKVRWYADETSYSFQTMTDGIRQFTIAGVDLEKATSAVQGVANLAGSAKVFDPFKVESAMNAISKSMQTGYMDTLKWTTLTNTAGIVTKDFSEKLLEAAAAEGTLIKSAAGQYKTKKGGKLVTTENIRDTLSQKWLTQGVLTKVLNEYNSATDAIKTFVSAVEDGTEDSWKAVQTYLPKEMKEFTSLDDIINEIQTNQDKYDESIVAMTKDMNANNMTTRQAGKLLQAIGVEFDEVAYKAFQSSQETTSFAQAIQYVRDAIKTSWSGVFEAMFGDVEKSTNLWSDVSDRFYSIFVAPFNSLEEEFVKWSEFEEGGASDFRQSILNIIDVVESFTSAIKSAFIDVFGGEFSEVLRKITLWLKDFTEGLKENETLTKAAAAIAKIIAVALKIILKVLGAGFKIVSALFKVVEPLLDIVVNVVSILADGLVKLINYLEEIGLFDAIVGAIVKVLLALGNVIKKVSKAFQTNKGLQKFGKTIRKIFEGIIWVINKVIDGIVKLINWFGDLFDITEEGEEKTSAFATVVEWLRNLFEKIAAPFKKLIEYFKQLDGKVKLDNIKESLKQFGLSLKEGVLSAFGSVKAWFEKTGIASWFAGLSEKLKPVGEFFKNLFHTIIDPLVEAAKTKDISTVMKFIGGLIGLTAMLLMLKAQWDLFYGMGKVLSSISDMFWALEAKFKAGFIKSIGIMFLLMSASLFIVVRSIVEIVQLYQKNIDEGRIKSLTISVLTIAAFFAAFIATAFILINGIKKIEGGYRAAILLIAVAGAIALCIKAVSTAFKQVKDVSWDTVGKAISIFAAVGLILGAILALGKIGVGGIKIFGATLSLSPLLITYAKVILSVWAFLEIFLWFTKKLSEQDQSTVDKAIQLIEIVFRGIATIVAVIGIVKIFSNNIKIANKVMGVFKSSPNNIGKGTGFVSDIGRILLGIAAIMFAISFLVKITSGVPLYKFVATMISCAAMLILVSGIAVTMTVIDRALPPQDKLTKTNLKIAGLMFSVSLSMLSIVGALALAALIPENIIKTGALRIMIIYGIIAVVAMLLLKIDKKLATPASYTKNMKGDIKSGNFESSKTGSSFYKSNIGSIILAITISTVAIALMLGYLAKMDTDTFWNGAWKAAIIFGFVAAISAGLLALDKISGDAKSKVIKPIGLIFAIVFTIAAIVGAIYVLSNLVNQDNLIKSIVIIGAILAVIIGAVIGFTILTKKYLNKMEDQTGLVAIALLIAAISIAIAIMAGVLFLLTHIDTKEAWKAMGLLAVLTILVIAIGAFVMKFGKAIGDHIKDALLGILAIFIVEVLIGGLIGLIMLAKLVTDEDVSNAITTYSLMMIPIAIMAGLIIAFGALIGHFGPVVLLGLAMMAGLELLMLGLIGILKLASMISKEEMNVAKENFLTISIILGIFSGICAALGLLAAPIAAGLAVLSVMELLLLGLIGIAALIAKVVGAFANNVQKLGDALKNIGDAIISLRVIQKGDLAKVEDIIDTIKKLKGVKIKTSFAKSISVLTKALSENLTEDFINKVNSFSSMLVNLNNTLQYLTDGKEFNKDYFTNMFESLVRAYQYVTDNWSKLESVLEHIKTINDNLAGGSSNAQVYANLFNSLIGLNGVDLSGLHDNLAAILGDDVIKNSLSDTLTSAISAVFNRDNMQNITDIVANLLSIINDNVDEDKMNIINTLFTNIQNSFQALDTIRLSIEGIDEILNKITSEEFFETFKKLTDIEYVEKIKHAYEEMITIFNGLKTDNITALTKMFKSIKKSEIVKLFDVTSEDTNGLLSIVNFFNNLAGVKFGEDAVASINSLTFAFINMINKFNSMDYTAFNSILSSLLEIIKKIKDKNGEAFEKFVNAFNNFNPDIINVLNRLSPGWFISLGNLLDTMAKNSSKLVKVLNALSPISDVDANAMIAFKELLETIQNIEEKDYNMTITITPVWNFTGDFNAGLNEIYGAGMATTNNAKRAQNAYNTALDSIKNNPFDPNNVYRLGEAARAQNHIVINQSFTDAMMYSYQATRATENAIEWATQGASNAIRGKK